MKPLSLRASKLWLMSLPLLLVAAMVYGQQPPSGLPPVGAPLIREGDLAIGLQGALGLGMTQDEVQAESRLGELGIAPRNGWIADYPVTPDVMGELEGAVGNAADSGKLSMSSDEAVKRLNEVAGQMGTSMPAYAGGTPQTLQAAPESYPDPGIVNDYYAAQGPPIVTYYNPPPDYYGLYAWVPYPFFSYGFWFPGYFILHDFHRVVRINNRPVIISNHFNDVRVHRVFRVDPGRRLSGRTFAGIGAPRSRAFLSTGVPRSDRAVFNAPRPRAAPVGRAFAPSSRAFAAPSRGAAAAPSRGGGGSGGGHGGGGRGRGGGGRGGGGHGR